MHGFLKTEGHTVAKVDLGDGNPIRGYYFTEVGQALAKMIERLRTRTIFDREAEYATKIKTVKEQPAEDVTLF